MQQKAKIETGKQDRYKLMSTSGVCLISVRIRDVYPGSRILLMNPESGMEKNQQKSEGEKFCCPTVQCKKNLVV